MIESNDIFEIMKYTNFQYLLSQCLAASYITTAFPQVPSLRQKTHLTNPSMH